MSDILSSFLLTQVINYGAPLFGLTLLLGAMGVPLPASLTVIAVGSFAQQGYFPVMQMACVGLLGAILGDAISFSMGNYGKGWVQNKVIHSPAWKNAQNTFQRRAGPAIFFTRFLVTALALPTNLIAGGSGYPFRRFMFYDLLGEALWIILYGGLGYAFGSQWEAVSDFISNFGSLLLGVIILGAGIWLTLNRQTAKSSVDPSPEI